ncbi:glutaredoxin family protein [Bacillus cereus]|uniref:glutaredoxin family protein n=1 Tax=Bacillus cereus TaxID=1396 RepID=UPI000BF5D6F5|nr:glutaredoxin family protein [Bacillus cereus]PEZ62974.1 NrdH-redoxin [Bacillus cereus]
MKKVIVYTKNNCPECEKMKANLWNVPVPLEVDFRNIQEESKYFDELVELGYQSVPVTIIEGHEPIVGFEIGELQNAFGI